ncbi:putative s-adenosylmethionine uptake transporter [Magnetospirillum gryphiswaldense MSR-1 v2]|uniref:S-adenosylmethionine uptake transporter n=1 Tax=Magnetospirillum gryphiswaldense (strain DSM 6361 / JCM 21280 / NBRC 15271 / MSR-1) TaxID=431944 RepID=V6EZZ1_MAGGM|nr:DMT family transporter [Magnetospirillum gryphiswaldense]CDK97788.1 putative s-adenosylmethionine uptake transporter [Magnetospirillum gryphiswaldense MSR-1 v2]
MAENRQVLGSLFMLASVFFFSAQLSFLKHASLSLHPFEVLFLRNAVAAAFMGVAFVVAGPTLLVGWRVFAIRAGFGFLAGLCLFYANANSALAAVAIIFHARIFPLTGLARLTLGERVSPCRWLGVAAGFLGILLIIMPERWNAWSLGLLAALGAALLSAASQVAVKALTEANAPLTVVAYSQLAFAIMSMAPAVSVWKAPEPWELAAITMGAAGGGLAMLAAAKAFSLAPASAVSPVDNIGIFVSALIGWVIFGETLSWNVALGGLLVSVSTIFVTTRT